MGKTGTNAGTEYYSFDQTWVSTDGGGTLTPYTVGTMTITSRSGSTGSPAPASSSVTSLNNYGYYPNFVDNGDGTSSVGFWAGNGAPIDGPYTTGMTFKTPGITTATTTGGASWSFTNTDASSSYVIQETFKIGSTTVTYSGTNQIYLKVTSIVVPEMNSGLFPQILLLLAGLFLLTRNRRLGADFGASI